MVAMTFADCEMEDDELMEKLKSKLIIIGVVLMVIVTAFVSLFIWYKKQINDFQKIRM